MAKKIIAFLSDYKDPTDEWVKEETYICPNGSKVKGTQTNEAPLLYLLKKHPDVSEILFIVTKEANKTWNALETALNKNGFSKVQMIKISYDLEENLTDELLPKVMEKVKAGDEILLETTGGPRIAIMDLLLLSRSLSYIGIKTVDAVYSNYNKKPKEIEDVTYMIDYFDLIGGMQEMTSFGNVRTLREYYQKKPKLKRDGKIDALLSSLENLNEAIVLCRARKIETCLDAFNKALKEAQKCDDPMMKMLLPAFSKKYGEKMDTPALIRWCIDSDMLQQALTIYTERIPAFLFENGYLTENKSPGFSKTEGNYYEDEFFQKFFYDLMQLSRTQQWKKILGGRPRSHTQERIRTLKHFNLIETKEFYSYICTTKELKTVCMDYMYVKSLRNLINHANSSEKSGEDKMILYLNKNQVSNKYVLQSDITMDSLKKMILKALENIKTIPHQ